MTEYWHECRKLAFGEYAEDSERKLAPFMRMVKVSHRDILSRKKEVGHNHFDDRTTYRAAFLKLYDFPNGHHASVINYGHCREEWLYEIQYFLSSGCSQSEKIVFYDRLKKLKFNPDPRYEPDFRNQCDYPMKWYDVELFLCVMLHQPRCRPCTFLKLVLYRRVQSTNLIDIIWSYVDLQEKCEVQAKIEHESNHLWKTHKNALGLLDECSTCMRLKKTIFGVQLYWIFANICFVGPKVCESVCV